MHILRISPAIYREGSWPVAFDPVGGLQMQVWRLTRQLAATGIEQTVLTSHIPGSPRRSAPFPHTTIRSVGPWLPQLLGRWFLNFAWFLGVLPELLLGIRRYDLVHVHFNHSVWCRFIVLIAAARGVPTVVSMNTALWGGLQDALDLRGKPHDIAHMIERRTLQAASRILSLTMTDASRKADEMQLDRKKFAVIPDAIELPTAGAEVGDNQTVSHFRQAFRIPADLPVVTYVGRISAEKGWEDLPALAAEDSADAAFLLVCGDGPDRSCGTRQQDCQPREPEESARRDPDGCGQRAAASGSDCGRACASHRTPHPNRLEQLRSRRR